MTEPTKKEMLILLDHLDCNECRRECPLYSPAYECSDVKDAIHALIESMPEPGRDTKKHWICESCGEEFDEPMPGGHSRAVDYGKGPVPVQCGPVSESGDVEAGPGQKADLVSDHTPTGGSIPPSGPMTDEEALIFFDKMSACGPCNHYDECADYQKEHSGKKMCEAYLDHLRARLAQKPKVTREKKAKLERWLYSEGACYSLYFSKRKAQQALDILGLEVEEK